MKNLFSLPAAALLLPAVLALGACAKNYDVAGVSAMKPAGDSFTQALHQRYIERAKFEVGEVDWASVDFFTGRAKMAAEGKAPAPQPVSERKISGAPAAELISAREKLVAALATSAPKDNPDACARAQTWLEHWMEQQEEGHQADHIAMTRDGYMKAMPDCVAKVAAMPAPKAMPAKIVKTFIVYFDLNKADLTPAANKTLAEVSAAYRDVKPDNVYLAGHTDTSGSGAYNQALSAKRSKAVGDALAKMGIASKALDMKSHGESKLAVATGDNVREAKNRRVEIHFEK